jgi:hypothetical protein
MTAEEKAIYKPKARQVLFDYVNKLGYPNLRNEEIMQHLPNMWRSLEENELMHSGFTYQMFLNVANEQFFIALISGGR